MYKKISILLIALFALPNYAQQPEPEIMITNGIQHSVPLEDIIFDDFDIASRMRPYTEASPDDIERLRDRIRPMCHGEIAACHPINYESAASANEWMSSRMMIVGYLSASGQAYAYPFNILNFHEIVNDTIDDQPVLISYCPLCNSAVVYSRLLDGDELIFGNTSALYQSDMVMYDLQTDSYWFQVEGRAILGELTNAELTPLPSIITTWESWQQTHPDTLVLQRPNTGINYGRDVFGGYNVRVNRGDTFFPVDDEYLLDQQLPAGENVLIVSINDESVAYPLGLMGNAATLDTVGGQEVVVLSLEAGPSGAAFLPETTDGISVALQYVDDTWVDSLTGSSFNLSGIAIDGELAGSQLVALPVRYTFWFAAIASTPEITVFNPTQR